MVAFGVSYYLCQAWACRYENAPVAMFLKVWAAFSRHRPGQVTDGKKNSKYETEVLTADRSGQSEPWMRKPKFRSYLHT